MRVCPNKVTLKKGFSGGQELFSPKHPDMKKPEKYVDPPRVGHTHTTPRKVPAKRQPKNPPTHTNEQPRHEVEETTSGQSNHDNPKMTTRIDKKETRTHSKNTTQAETQKRKSSNKEDNESKECKHKRQLDRKKVVCQNTKHKKKQI